MSRIWKPNEVAILKDKYPNVLTVDLLPLLPGRTVAGITGQAGVLGLKKSSFFYKSGLSGRITANNDIGINTRFKNNYAGWNKGKKQSEFMSPEGIERTKATRFIKGQDPHNTLPMGSERISKDGYIEIKVKHLKNGDANNKNFEFKHRVEYKKHHGLIPKGMIVEFLDRDKRNFAPENLVLKSRKENLMQNTMSDTSIVKRFLKIKEPEIVEKIIEEMPSLIELKRNQILLNKKIKTHARSIE